MVREAGGRKEGVQRKAWERWEAKMRGIKDKGDNDGLDDLRDIRSIEGMEDKECLGKIKGLIDMDGKYGI